MTTKTDGSDYSMCEAFAAQCKRLEGGAASISGPLAPPLCAGMPAANGRGPVALAVLRLTVDKGASGVAAKIAAVVAKALPAGAMPHGALFVYASRIPKQADAPIWGAAIAELVVAQCLPAQAKSQTAQLCFPEPFSEQLEIGSAAYGAAKSGGLSIRIFLIDRGAGAIAAPKDAKVWGLLVSEFQPDGGVSVSVETTAFADQALLDQGFWAARDLEGRLNFGKL